MLLTLDTTYTSPFTQPALHRRVGAMNPRLDLRVSRRLTGCANRESVRILRNRLQYLEVHEVRIKGEE